MPSRKGYNLEESISNPRFEQWNMTSFFGICAMVLGRDPIGMDLGYDPTGLKEPPTIEERELALRLLNIAIAKVVRYPVPGMKQVLKDTRDWARRNPSKSASDSEIKVIMSSADPTVRGFSDGSFLTPYKG